MAPEESSPHPIKQGAPEELQRNPPRGGGGTEALRRGSNDAGVQQLAEAVERRLGRAGAAYDEVERRLAAQGLGASPPPQPTKKAATLGAAAHLAAAQPAAAQPIAAHPAGATALCHRSGERDFQSAVFQRSHLRPAVLHRRRRGRQLLP